MAAVAWRVEEKIMTKDEPIKGLFVGETDVTLNDMWAIKNTPNNRRI
jgi:hypothetical protein